MSLFIFIFIFIYFLNLISPKSYFLQDFMLATMLVRPGNLFLDHITKEVMITEENFGSLSRAYIVCKEDKSIAVDFQRWMIERSPGVEVKEIEGADHMVMLSKTKELYSILQDIAREHH